MRPGRQLAVLGLIFVVLYLLVFFSGGASGGFKDRLEPRLGLDLIGGTRLTLEATNSLDGKPPTAENLEEARQIIESRVNAYGVAEAEVVTEGNRNIVVSLPGENRELTDVGDAAELRFRKVLKVADGSGTVTPPAANATPVPSALLVHAFDDGDPATSADAAPAAHRIEIDAELACRLEHAHPFGKAPALAGGREGDGEFGHAFDSPITPWPGLARPPTPLPREKEDADGRDDPRNEAEHGHDAMHGRASSWWRLLPAAGLDERAQATFVIVALDTLDLCEDGGFEILPAGQGLALSPIGEIGVGAGRAASHRGHVDRLREARRQLALDASAPARAGRRCGDLSWNIAPIGDAELCHRAYREGCRGAMAAGGAGVCRARKPSRPVKPVTRFSNGRPSKPAAASALLSRSASGA